MGTEKPRRRYLVKDPTAMLIVGQCVAARMSDREIIDKLERECGYRWSIDAVAKARRVIAPADDPGAAVQSPTLSSPPPGLPEADKANWFRSQFRQSHLYKNLCDQFDADEVKTYLEEYGGICCQFEDILTSEFYAIDDFLKHRLLINQQLSERKRLRQEIEVSTAWLAANPTKADATKEELKERVEKMRLLDGLHTALHQAGERYDKYVAERQAIQKSLAATRRDRLEELRTTGVSFFQVVQELQTSEKARHQHGRYAELTRLASEEIQAEFRKPTEFPDGEQGPIILDDAAELDEEGEEDEPGDAEGSDHAGAVDAGDGNLVAGDDHGQEAALGDFADST